MDKDKLLELIAAYGNADWNAGYQRGRIATGGFSREWVEFEDEAIERRRKIRAQIIAMLEGNDDNTTDD